jgi:hypothetical protein
MMKHHFEHDFEDDPPRGDFEVNLDAPQGARIRVDSGDDGVWISANRAGWLHLARKCLVPVRAFVMSEPVTNPDANSFD